MEQRPFQLVSNFTATGDQPAAIDALVHRFKQGESNQVLLGVTGSGKTFTMANVIACLNKPTLVISHNKTLAAQLYEEFCELFPNNAISYFVSYYDYYQPEAYIPQRDIYIEKDASRNDDLDRLRLAATSHLISRRDVVVVASVSCIFGLGSPVEYKKSVLSVTKGDSLDRQSFLKALADLQYARKDVDFQRGSFRVRGDVIELHQAGDEFAYRIDLFGDEVDRIQLINPTSGEMLAEETQLFIYPAVHYMMNQQTLDHATASIRAELDDQVIKLRSAGKLLEAQRLLARTRYDLEMIEEVGYCSGIENYSRHLDGRAPGSKPFTLLDYFPNGEANDWLVFIDESHVTIPQMHAMYHGDRHRKQVLVEHGFRLPSALDNRPLQFEEVEQVWPQVLFVSATPGPYELDRTSGNVVEQLIRPTGLVDPQIHVRSATNQVPDLEAAIRQRVQRNERTLVTTLTKRLAENLATYLTEQSLRCRYLHSEIDTLDRVAILKDLRSGRFDVLVGVNLLREGLDLPEVSLVAILDADKTGFLRSSTSLIQQIGRAARNVNAEVILYADSVSPAMKQAIEETARRRTKQLAHNREHGITPKTVTKQIRQGIELELRARQTARHAIGLEEEEFDQTELIADLERQMVKAAKDLKFEHAAVLRDRIRQIKDTPRTSKPTATSDVCDQSKAGTPGRRVVRKRKLRSR